MHGARQKPERSCERQNSASLWVVVVTAGEEFCPCVENRGYVVVALCLRNALRHGCVR
jgi:hypothetical protein